MTKSVIKPHLTETEKLEEFCKFFIVKNYDVIIDHYEFIERLKELGFVRYDEKGKNSYLHVKDNVCTVVEQKNIIDIFIN